MIVRWEKLPDKMKNEYIKPYYEHLEKQKFNLILKRGFDIIFSLILLILLSPIMLLLMIVIPLESKGGPFFIQKRITQYNRSFNIIKFRTMKKHNLDSASQITVQNDQRVTKVGKLIRNIRLDEISQLINVLLGDMTFVGTRPEVPKFVNAYSPEMYATLLLPAGVTSQASIQFRNEEELLDASDNPEQTYIEDVLPQKMKINLDYVENFSLLNDFKIIIQTLKLLFT